MALQGSLSYLEIAYLLQMTGSGKKSGMLVVTSDDREARLFFDRGKLVRAQSNRSHEGIGSLLVRAGLLTETQLESALQRQAAEGSGRRLGTILCEEFDIGPGDVERLLRRQFERIVLDVFSWPGGTFEFHFTEAARVADRFCLEPADFILGVGIRAGLLAEEGLAQERSSPELPSIALIESDADLRGRCLARWRLEGYRGSAFGLPEEAIAFLGDTPSASPPGAFLVDVGPPASFETGLRALGRIHAAFPDGKVIAFGLAGPDQQAALRGAGAVAFVAKPTAADLEGPHADFHLDGFLMALQRAVATCSGREGTAPGRVKGA
ncbi:MAG: DUF4388 domain-containing protein [Deltaproteobacteria bacterium]|nr:DUF4388 domain-containing protein [Deltaproteobacteria bacterium]